MRRVVNCMRCVSGEVRAGDGDGGDGGGFGAEDSGAKGDRLPLVLGEEGDFFWGPAAFGAYRDGSVPFYIPPFSTPTSRSPRRGARFAVRLRRMGHPVDCGRFGEFLIGFAELGVFEGGGEGDGLFGFA